MPSSDDPRYDELLSAMFLGEAPDWVKPAERTRLQLASDGHRLSMSHTLGTSLPRASFYATAHFGIAFLDGVSRVVLEQAPREAPFARKVVEAALEWGQTIARPDLAALLAYEAWIDSGLSPYDGPDKQEIEEAAALPSGFALRQFDHDVLGFCALLDRFRERFAPAEIVRRYSAEARPQLIAAFQHEDETRVKEIAS